ncbi:MAG TPA: PhzF family phenazine biosynthesis protein [Xanthobacteraceae bacterium]|jgi:trans-2,3-dihydro-3-hydroxyanthranilate isomerase|nr:PhzF family phenazine biosynthesis protein [Xanthobacteraceae bacterium]
MRRRFVTLDVFTNRRFAGNPLAVVLDSHGLDDVTMQTIAREFNLAETVFVFPPSDAKHRAKLRIFTPGVELQFAGHPTVGTAVQLARIDGGSGQRPMVLEEGAGPVHCLVQPIDADRGSARFVLPRLPTEVAPVLDRTMIAKALGLSDDDIGFDEFVPARWSAAGPTFTFVPVRTLAAVKQCKPHSAHWEAAIEQDGARAAYVFCRETVESGHAFHARMFAPKLGIPEDPATGAAIAAFAGLFTQTAKPQDGEHQLDIEQGYEMGRPSLLRLSLTIKQKSLVEAAIAGEAITVSEGTIDA